MDTVCISELQVDTIIGIHDWERRVRQTVVLSLELGTDTRKAAASDAIGDALDYATLTSEITALVRDAGCELLEALAERVTGHVMDKHGVPWVRLDLRKPGAVPGARYVGLIIERGSRT